METEIEIQVTLPDGQIIDCPVIVVFDASYTPAKVSGPPEDCYPEDAELDIQEYRTDAEWNLSYGITPELFDEALDANSDRIEDACWEAYHEACAEARYAD
jgi:hypothetical protein